MKVYFGGSSQKLKDRRKDYLAIRKVILDCGHSLTRDWVKKEIEGDTLQPHAKYYDLALKAINNADAVVLDYTAWTPSVGMQLLMALDKGIPTLLLLDSRDPRRNKSLADEFISPRYFKYIKRSVFTNKNAFKIINEFLAWAEESKPIVRFNLEIEKELDDYLKKIATKNNTSKAEEIRRLIQEKANA